MHGLCIEVKSAPRKWLGACGAFHIPISSESDTYCEVPDQTLAARLREVHDVVDDVRDIATASLIENWIDETERRTWFLFESSRHGDITGH